MSLTDYRKADEIIASIFNNPDDIEKFQLTRDLNKGWESIVSSISSNKAAGNRLGLFLVAHTRIIDLKNKILLVETDHPGYIQTLQMYNSYIMRGIKKKYPQIEINSISYRLKNSDAHIYDIAQDENLQNANSQKRDDDSKDFVINPDLPEELKIAFENIKNAMSEN